MMISAVVFQETGWNVISVTSIFPGKAALNLADADAIREVSRAHSKFPKPAELYVALSRFGKVITILYISYKF